MAQVECTPLPRPCWGSWGRGRTARFGLWVQGSWGLRDHLGNLRPGEEQGLARGLWDVGVGQLSRPNGAAGGWRGPRVRGQSTSRGPGDESSSPGPCPWQVTLLQASRLCPESRVALARAPGRAGAQQEPRASQWFLFITE